MNETKTPATAGTVEPTMARHCLNSFCDGPEWWAVFDETPDTYRDCPSCGYPCPRERVPEQAMTTEEICAALLAHSFALNANNAA